MSQELNEFQRMLVNDEICQKAFIEFGVAVFRREATDELEYWQGKEDDPFNEMDPDEVLELSKKPYEIFQDLIKNLTYHSVSYNAYTLIQCECKNEEIKPYLETLLKQQTKVVNPAGYTTYPSNLQTALNWYKHEIFHECIDLFEGFAKERERLQTLLNL